MIGDPRTRAEAVDLIRARGLGAELRDWSMGKTIVVMDGKSHANGIDVWERVVWIVEDPTPCEWTVVLLNGFERVLGRFQSLGLACERAILAVQPTSDIDRLDAAFEVESVLEARGRVHVVTKLVHSTGDFVVAESSKLHGCAVERWLDMPRAHDASRPRIDQFAFCLRNAADQRHFHAGTVVALTSAKERDAGTANG